MANLVIPSKYAQALFEAALAAGRVQEVKESLAGIKEVLKENPGLRTVLYHPGINRDDKKSILKQLFEGMADKMAMDFVLLVIDRKRENLLETICALYEAKAEESQGVKEITVETAYPLGATEKEDVKKSLEKIFKKKLKMDSRVRAGIMGGIIIRDNLSVIDASVSGFLESLRAKLKETKVRGKKSGAKKSGAKKRPAVKKASKKKK